MDKGIVGKAGSNNWERWKMANWWSNGKSFVRVDTWALVGWTETFSKVDHDNCTWKEESEKDLFITGDSWLDRFIHRNRLLLIMKTTAQQDPSYLIDKLIVYVLGVCHLSRWLKCDPESIIAVDETSP